MLNFIWLGLIALAIIIGGATGKIGLVGQAAIDRANVAVTVAAGLVAIMTLWLGLMRLAEKAGLVNRLGLALRPIMVWLFPEVPPDHPAMGAIVMNVAANILGLNNAATPLGLRAMSELEKLNKRPGVATNAMCMLLAINTSSITLIPVTVIGILAFYKSKNPTSIIGTTIAATMVAHGAAILACKLLEKSPWYRLKPLRDAPAPESAKAETPSEAKTEGEHVQDKTRHTDESLPWVRGSKWILAGVAGLFGGMLIGTAFPELARSVTIHVAQTFPTLAHWFSISTTLGPLPDDETRLRFPAAWYGTLGYDLVRSIDALSLLAIPWLILFFPLYAALRGIPVYEEFVEGGKEGFNVILRILPYVVGMLVAIGMFTAAGGMAIITSFISPITNLIGFPAQLVPLAVIRPFSSAASLPLLQDLASTYGPDNILTLTAGTLYGCSETTFYVIAVYFGSVGIRKTRHAIPAGLVADVIGPVASVLICRAVFS